MKKVLVLGCTGSIGTSALDVIDQFPDKYKVAGISANTSEEKLQKLGLKYKCPTCLVSQVGDKGLVNFISNNNADIVVNGISGAAGLMPSVASLESGKDLALANKETIVMAGSLIKELAKKKKKQILPVDSEHSAVFNLIERIGKNTVSQIILTASGGPFRNYTKEQLANVTLEDALHHPTWNMGKKITIDSASLANKGLEVIEACLLFNIPSDRVKVTIHPQSLVHSLIKTNDGELYAQMSLPDMRHPILSALSWPDFYPNNMEVLDLCDLTMTFSKPNFDVFPMLSLAYNSAKLMNGYPIVFNAANEIAVKAFIEKQISFNDISVITEKTLSKDWSMSVTSIDSVFSIDREARLTASSYI